MIKLQLDSRDLRKLRTLRRNIKQVPRLMQNAMKGKRGRLANKALRALTREPGKPNYPLRWQSARQRRAFFASGGFGRGIPTQRSGKLLQSWDVKYENTSEGGVVSLVNPVSYMKFVQGDEAQRFHLDTGYVQVEDVVDDYQQEVGDVVVETWFAVADPTKGI